MREGGDGRRAILEPTAEKIRLPVPGRPPSRWSVGTLIPLTIVAWAALDLGLRFVPMGWLNLYPYQIATRHPGRYSPFGPNLRLRQERPIGELALMANLAPTETRGPIRFTTDALGFRATPSAPPGKNVRILLMEGDSFTFGAGLSDDETFPELLSRGLNASAYNAGRFYTDPERLTELDWLLARLPRGPLTVVYVLLEPFDLDLDRRYDGGAIDRLGARTLGAAYFEAKDELRYLRRWWQLWWGVSPLKILATRAWKTLCDDRILPNEYRKNVEERRLPDGRRFLLEHKNVERYLKPPDPGAVRKTAAYLAWLRDEVRARDADFWVLLVPEGVSVYGPWLLGKELPQVAEGLPYFDYLERELSRRRLKVVNGLAVLRKSAAREIETGELSYYREDHHWNPNGVRKISEALAGALRADPDFNAAGR